MATINWSPGIIFIIVAYISTVASGPTTQSSSVTTPANSGTTSSSGGSGGISGGISGAVSGGVSSATNALNSTISPTLQTPPTGFSSVFGFPKAWNPIPDGFMQRGFNATDVWFADPDITQDNKHWNTNTQAYMYLGGYYNPAFGMIVRDFLELFADAESVIRDIVELVIAVIRLIRCGAVALWSDEKIQQYERPQTNLFARQMSIFSKRERVDDRLFDSTTEEPELFRCIKREGNQVTLVLWYIPKFFYYWGKIPARGISLLVRLVVSIVRGFTPEASLGIGIDHHACYVVCQIFSEKAGTLCQETCGGVQAAALGAVMDVLNCWNEDLAVESYDAIRIVFTDVDDKISNDEMDWYSNLTTWRVADSQDYVRYDGTARMDRYYRDTAARIMGNELFEPHPTQLLINMLLRAKENWCMATFMPPVNELDRLEFKIKYLSYMAKNDKRLDSAELKCLLVYVAPNLAYSTDVFKDSVHERDHVRTRLIDIAKSVSMLDVTGMDLDKQDDLLKAMNEFFRHHVHQIYAKNTYNKWTKEEFYDKTKDPKTGLTPKEKVKKTQKEFEKTMQAIGFGFKESFQKMVDKAKKEGILEGGMFGSKENRLRVRSELMIFAAITRAKNQEEFVPDGLKLEDGIDESLNLRQPSYWQHPKSNLRMDKVQLKEEGDKDDNYPSGFGRTKQIFQKGLLDLILLRSSGQHSSVFKLATESTYELTTPPLPQILQKFQPYLGKTLPWLFN